jgi:predicted nucleotidyltransferase
LTAELDVAIDFDRAAIEAFCRRWHINELALFGSVLTNEFRPDSDVDFLAVFHEPQPDWGPWLRRWHEMEGELSAIVGRPIDLVERKTVEESENYIRRRHILSHQRTLYVAR